jgi:hypothetical protein
VLDHGGPKFIEAVLRALGKDLDAFASELGGHVKARPYLRAMLERVLHAIRTEMRAAARRRKKKARHSR